MRTLTEDDVLLERDSFGQSIAKALLLAHSDAIIGADSRGIIQFWNPGAERIFGFTAAEALGQSLDIIIPERLRGRHWEGFDRVMQTGQSRYGAADLLAVPAVRKDGSQISIEFTVALLQGKDGEVTGIAATLRDVTTRVEELRALKRKLAQQNG